MATVPATPAKSPAKAAPRDPRVYHPLDQLRGIIRRYVVVEGVLSALIFLGAWFVLALLLDFVVFKAFTWDWVQDGGRWIRVVALVVALTLLAGIVVFRIVRRLTTEFSYPALALVLERRFPKVLGDRLITAVELADVEAAAEYGYSAAMIRQTIDEARDRVGTVPVREVFNWRRLRMMTLIAFGIPLAVVVVAFATHAVATRDFSPVRAGWKTAHVTGILAERDLLLWNIPWPRRALLELQGDARDGLRVARDGAAPRIKVKSYQWVIADRSRPDGWRALLWSDVTESLVGVAVPAVPFRSMVYDHEQNYRCTALAAVGSLAMNQIAPDESLTFHTDPAQWTVDAVYERAREAEAPASLDESAPQIRRLKKKMGEAAFRDLQTVFEKLEGIANDPSYGRRLRRLDRPESVSYAYTGVKTAGTGGLTSEGSSEYGGDITGLKEDVMFVVKAEDYRTPEKPITLIPPPTLNRLTRVEHQPAYLHYAPPEGEGYPALRGLRQQMREEKISLTGDKSVFVVPAGTEVVITGVTELPIVQAWARPRVGRVPGAKPGSAEPVPLAVTTFEEKAGDKNEERGMFKIEFRGGDRVTSQVEFDIEYENSDKVRSVRQVLIQVTEDQAPVVEIAPEWIRRVGNVYYVTPRAKIPFNPESYLRDDNGLSKVEYVVSYYSEDSDLARVMRAGLVTRAIIPPVGPAAARLPATLQTAYHANAFRFLDKGDSRLNASFLLGQFFVKEKEIRRETKAHLLDLLSRPLAGERVELVKKLGLKTELVRRSASADPYKWQVEGDFFDVRELGLEVAPGEIQPRYRIDLNVQATDTNFDTGPKASRNAEPIRLLVISSGDLLVEIGKEEESLGGKLDEALAKLATAKVKFAFVRSKHEFRLPDELPAVRVRSKDTGQDVAKAREVVQNVSREFRRIERECIFNQLEDRTIAQYGKFANRLARVLGENPPPASAEEEEQLRTGRLAPQQTFPDTQDLLGKIQTALDEGRFGDPGMVTDAEIALHALEREVSDIRKALGEAQSKERLRKLINKLIEDQEQRVGNEIKKWMRDLDFENTRESPAIGQVGAVFLAKGETKKIKHTIRWRQYKEDILVVKVASSNPTAVIVPGELKLDFEKDNLSFEYEIRAGNTDGDYTVTLTPAVGDKVVVKVTVK
jgi:hypothetical protein